MQTKTFKKLTIITYDNFKYMATRTTEMVYIRPYGLNSTKQGRKGELWVEIKIAELLNSRNQLSKYGSDQFID